MYMQEETDVIFTNTFRVTFDIQRTVSTFSQTLKYKNYIYSIILHFIPYCVSEYVLLKCLYWSSFRAGADREFQVRGAHLKNLRRAEGGTKIFGVFRVKNHDFTPKNHIFSNFRGGGARRVRPPPWIRPCKVLFKVDIKIYFFGESLY